MCALKSSLQITCSITRLRGAGISMVDAVVKVLTFFVVVILVLILLDTLGGFIATQIPNAALAVRRIIKSLWNSAQGVAHHHQSLHMLGSVHGC
jgi:hypothetical protein